MDLSEVTGNLFIAKYTDVKNADIAKSIKAFKTFILLGS